MPVFNLHTYLFIPHYIPSNPLDSMTWAEISQVVNSGQAPLYLQIGDYKTDGNYTCTLVGLNQDGQNTATFSLGVVGNGFIDAGGFIGNDYWETTSSSYTGGITRGDVESGLSVDLKNIMKTVTKSYKVHDSSGQGSTNTGSFTLFPPNYDEVSGGVSSYQYYVNNPLIGNGIWSRDNYEYSVSRNPSTLVRDTYCKYYTLESSGSHDGYYERYKEDQGTIISFTGTRYNYLMLMFVI